MIGRYVSLCLICPERAAGVVHKNFGSNRVLKTLILIFPIYPFEFAFFTHEGSRPLKNILGTEMFMPQSVVRRGL